jgi:hypothetical protein
MTPLRTLRGGVELWRCERCGADVVFVDDCTWDRARPAERQTTVSSSVQHGGSP